jgi:acyl carrier protein
MKTAFGIFVCIGLCIAFAKMEKWRRERKIALAFDGRESLSPQEFHQRYFEKRRIPFHIVEKVRMILEERLCADMSRLGEKDDFTRELQFFWAFDSMASVEIVLALEKAFDIAIDDAETNSVRTVSDIVLLIHSKILEKNEANRAATWRAAPTRYQEVTLH